MKFLFKLFLWRIGLLKKDICPYCKKRLVEHYGEREYTRTYDCYTKRCRFNE
jgi:hypothetical protein